jgi:hypothetical protein
MFSMLVEQAAFIRHIETKNFRKLIVIRCLCLVVVSIPHLHLRAVQVSYSTTRA